MAVVAARTAEEAARVVRRVALVVDQTAVLATPVDTGRARSNWAVQVGSPIEGEHVVQGFDRSGGSSLSQAEDALQEYKITAGVIFVANNVPYIEQLENGSSAQAPGGMLSAALQAGIAVAKGERIDLRR
jgi:hypothetical protein